MQGQQTFALRCQFDFTLTAFEQRDLQILFEFRHRAAECGLGHIEHPRSTREVADISHNLKVF